MTSPPQNPSVQRQLSSSLMFSGIVLYFCHVFQKAQARETGSYMDIPDELAVTLEGNLASLQAVHHDEYSGDDESLVILSDNISTINITDSVSDSDIAEVMSTHAFITSSALSDNDDVHSTGISMWLLGGVAVTGGGLVAMNSSSSETSQSVSADSTGGQSAPVYTTTDEISSVSYMNSDDDTSDISITSSSGIYTASGYGASESDSSDDASTEYSDSSLSPTISSEKNSAELSIINQVIGFSLDEAPSYFNATLNDKLYAVSGNVLSVYQSDESGVLGQTNQVTLPGLTEYSNIQNIFVAPYTVIQENADDGIEQLSLPKKLLITDTGDSKTFYSFSLNDNANITALNYVSTYSSEISDKVLGNFSHLGSEVAASLSTDSYTWITKSDTSTIVDLVNNKQPLASWITEEGIESVRLPSAFKGEVLSTHLLSQGEVLIRSSLGEISTIHLVNYASSNARVIQTGELSKIFSFDLNRDNNEDSFWFDMSAATINIVSSNRDSYDYITSPMEYLAISETLISLNTLDMKWLSDGSLSVAFSGVNDLQESEVYNYSLSSSEVEELYLNATSFDDDIVI
ncbi:MAG: hypothetical protein CL816_07325 [Coxiellaceae bacterium]|nr:hypothetical protein [Coxiellaceae bacterium]|tara:strand:+ start:396 stop:2120 length:1725 start_codon:yes stop_codon:yes gene_type:complete